MKAIASHTIDGFARAAPRFLHPATHYCARCTELFFSQTPDSGSCRAYRRSVLLVAGVLVGVASGRAGVTAAGGVRGMMVVPLRRSGAMASILDPSLPVGFLPSTIFYCKNVADMRQYPAYGKI